MTTPRKTFSVELTFAQIRDLATTLQAAHAAEAYYAEKTYSDDPDSEDFSKPDSWERRNTRDAIAKRAMLAGLYEAITGSPIKED